LDVFFGKVNQEMRTIGENASASSNGNRKGSTGKFILSFYLQFLIQTAAMPKSSSVSTDLSTSNIDATFMDDHSLSDQFAKVCCVCVFGKV
jgi:hypothetical protein